MKVRCASDGFQIFADAKFLIVTKLSTKFCSDNGTPRTIRTDNGSCFKSNDFKEFCAGETIKRIRCTPNIQICSHHILGLVFFKSVSRYARIGILYLFFSFFPSLMIDFVFPIVRFVPIVRTCLGRCSFSDSSFMTAP